MKTPSFQLRKILVPVDFSNHSEEALKYAALLAALYEGKISLLHVFEPVRLMEEYAEFGTSLAAIPQLAKERLSMLATRFDEASLLEKIEVREGRPAETIGHAASEFGSDLIVISTHGYTGLDYVLLGGTAQRVIRHAPCPVLVARGQKADPRLPQKILVPVDFSPASFAGLRCALALARKAGSRVTALHVVEPLGPLQRLEIDVDAYEKKLSHEVKERLQGLHAEIGEPAGAFDTIFREGVPVHETVETEKSGSFDLVVMGSIGRSGLADMVLGSTAECVVRHAAGPVLVVRSARKAVEVQLS